MFILYLVGEKIKWKKERKEGQTIGKEEKEDGQIPFIGSRLNSASYYFL
jgi:hypothetical protein